MPPAAPRNCSITVSVQLEDDGNTAISEMIITRKGSERIIRKAFDLARQDGR